MLARNLLGIFVLLASIVSIPVSIYQNRKIKELETTVNDVVKANDLQLPIDVEHKTLKELMDDSKN